MKTMEPITYKRVSKPKKQNEYRLNAETVAAAVIGLLIARGNILGCMAPLGMAWCAAVSVLPQSFAVMLGCAIGICLMDMGIVKLKYIAAIGIFGLLKKYYKPEKWESKEYSIGMMCAVSIVCTLATAAFTGFLYYDIAIGIFECAAIWASGIIFSGSEKVIRRKGQVVSDEESIAVAIMAGAAVAGLQGISIFGIRPANILSMYIILFTAYKGGIGISGAVGAALGIITAMSQGDAAALTGVYAFVGLTAGIMNMFGKTGVLIAAICANAVFSAYYSSSALILINVFEIVAAGIGFYFSSDGMLGYIEKYSIKTAVYTPEKGQLLYERMKTASAFAMLKRALSGMAKAFESKTGEDCDKIAVICDAAAMRVCDKCSLGKYCWSKNFNNTATLFSSIALQLQNDREDRIADVVAGRCVRGEALANAVKELHNNYRREKIIENRAEEYVNGAAKQWNKLAGRIDAIGKNIYCDNEGDEFFSENISRALSLIGAQSPVTDVRKNELGLYNVTIKTKNPITFDITVPVENILDRRMTVKSEISADGGSVTVLEEETYFDYDIAVVTMDKIGTDVSGDCGEYFVNDGGVLSCVISDGMGSGGKAAEESKEIIDIFKNLSEGGFSLAESLQIINTGMINKSRGERCATFDCVNINLYNGKAEYIKAGGVATVVKSGDETSLLKNSAMPLGILNSEEIRESYFEIEGETYFIMMTDGVPDNCGDREYGEDWAKNIVSASGNVSAKEMADNIMVSAIANGKPRDDMMVMAVRIFPKTGI